MRRREEIGRPAEVEGVERDRKTGGQGDEEGRR